LQALGFELDAIDDFNEAIAREPEDANLYFMRAMSKGHTGDFDGSISDHQEAVRLSKADTQNNAYLNDYAKETGWPSATTFYEQYLRFAQIDNSELGHICAEERRRKESSSWRRTRQAT
jgi:tetratricopeptide (TPR) repeat protein